MTQRPEVLEGVSPRRKTKCGTLYCTLTYMDGSLQELFATMGKSGTCARAQMEGIGRLISIAINPEDTLEKRIANVTKTISGISCGGATDELPSCLTQIARIMKKYGMKEEEPSK